MREVHSDPVTYHPEGSLIVWGMRLRVLFLINDPDARGELRETVSLLLAGDIDPNRVSRREIQRLAEHVTAGSASAPEVEILESESYAGYPLLDYLIQTAGSGVVGAAAWEVLVRLSRRALKKGRYNGGYPWSVVNRDADHDPSSRALSEYNVVHLARVVTLKDFTLETDDLEVLSTTLGDSDATVVLRGGDGSIFTVVMTIRPGGVVSRITRAYPDVPG